MLFALTTLPQDTASVPAAASAALPHRQKRRKPGVWTQFRVLLWRESISILRNPADIAGRMLVFVWLGIFVGLLFYDMQITIQARCRFDCMPCCMTEGCA